MTSSIRSRLVRGSGIWDTAQKFAELNPLLDAAEMGLEIDTGLFKFGNGVLPWNELEYANLAASPSDGYYLRQGRSWIKLADASQVLKFEEVQLTLGDGSTRTVKMLVAEDASSQGSGGSE